MKKKSLLFILLLAVFAPFAMNAQSSITVCDGTVEEQHIPIYAYSGDTQGTTSEFIIPESNLTQLNGKEISALKFYLSQTQSKTWTAVYQVYMAEVATTQLTRTIGPDAATVVYEGTLDASSSEMTITFNSNYTYNGGHLLIGTYVKTAGAWDSNGKFYGISATSAAYLSGSWGGYDDGAVDFIPKTTFVYLTNEPYITLSPTSETVLTGLTKTLTASYGNVSGTPTISYTSSNTSVATVTGNGTTTATVTGVAAGNATITVTMTYDGHDYTATSDITVEDPSYCTPYYSQTSDYIAAFTTTGGEDNINNVSSAQGTGGYSDFYNSYFVSAQPGTTINFTVTRGYDDSYKYAIWVDWNHDYVFDVDTETMAEMTTSQKADWEDSFVIPANATAGDYRMRVEMLYGSTNTLNPCVSASYGEVEDYKLTVSIPAACMPYGITVEALWNTANLDWENTSDSYKVRYRTAAHEQPAADAFFEDFEEGLDDWTVLVNAQGTGWHQFDPSNFNYEAHSGNYVALTQSYYQNSDITADNWLISPEITLHKDMSFWAMGDPSYPEGYSVCVSTTGTDITKDFIVVETYDENPSTWTQYTVDLRDYDGQKGYIAFHHEQYGGDFLFIDDVLVGDMESIPAGNWTTRPTTDPSIELTGLTTDTEYDYQILGICDGIESDWTNIRSFTTRSAKEKFFVTEGQWNVADNWMPEGAPTADQTVTINAPVTIPNGCIATAKELILGTGGSILIQDGGQLQYDKGNEIEVTAEKTIKGYTSTKDNYYLISSPFGFAYSTEVENLLTGDYDFYKFDGAASDGLEWRNYKTSTFNMSTGYGYLYANSATTTLRFTGELLDPSYYYVGGSSSSYLTYDESADFGTFNLVGNVYTREGVIYYYPSWEEVTDYYVMNEAGTKLVPSTGSLAPMQGAFIQATAANQLGLVGVAESSKKDSNNAMLNMTITSNNEFVDMARIRFGENRGLEKFQLDRESSKLYMPVDGKDYAVVYNNAEGEMPLNFKAETTGTYTISFNLDGANVGYLHLIDKFAGKDINLLTTPEYSFIGSAVDAEDRFIVRFSETAANSAFVYQNGDNLIVNGEGTLQVFDVMGRFIGSYEVNGSMSISASQFNDAVYIFRMIGNEVMTQKVVVR